MSLANAVFPPTIDTAIAMTPPIIFVRSGSSWYREQRWQVASIGFEGYKLSINDGTNLAASA
jgi:hypothetical protein